MQLAALRAATGQFCEIGVTVNAAATLTRDIVQGGPMLEPAPFHLAHELLVAANDVVRLDQLVIEEALQADALPHTSNQHVQFNMLSQ